MIHFQNDHITVFQSALYKTTATVVETRDLVLVVDPNWLPEEVDQIKQHVANIQNDRPLYLLFTHSDYDHIIGYKAFPDAKVIASRAFVDHPEKEEPISQIHEFDDKYYIERDYEIAYPKVDIIIEEDGQELVIGETRFTFYTAPGHTPDGIFTIIEPSGIWIAGDYLSDIEFPFIEDSGMGYEETLLKAERNLREHEINLLVPGHGQVTESKANMQSRIKDAQVYIRDLRAAVENGDAVKIDDLFDTNAFPAGSRAAHVHNQTLLAAELGI